MLESVMASFFTKKNLIETLKTFPKVATPVRDWFFPESRRKLKASPFIALGEVENITGALPIVKRGSASYPVGAGAKSTELLQVEGFKPSVFVSAKDMNDSVFTEDASSLQQVLSEKVEMLRDRIAASTEVLCAQSLSGTITYPAVSEGGVTDYTVKLGAPKTMKEVSVAGKDLGALQKMLEEHLLEQSKTGASQNVIFIAGSDVYGEIVSILTKVSSQVPVEWTRSGLVLFGKYDIRPFTATYALPGKKEVTPVIDAKSMKTVDLSNAGTLFYLALDDFDARLQAAPFFAKYVKSDDPSGYKIIAMSKPLPAFAVSKTVDRKYLAK